MNVREMNLGSRYIVYVVHCSCYNLPGTLDRWLRLGLRYDLFIRIGFSSIRIIVNYEKLRPLRAMFYWKMWRS